MKDVVIPARSICRELLILGLSILVALTVNAGAIMAYQTQWIELLTTWHITLALAAVFYFLILIPRVGWTLLRRWLTRSHARARPSE